MDSQILKLKNIALNSKYSSMASEFFFTSETKYNYFSMDREYFLDVFEVRLQTNKMMGIVINGLEDAFNNFKHSDDNTIVSHSLEIDKKEIIIYTNTELDTIFGVVEFWNISKNW